jgi:hypothetical protein
MSYTDEALKFVATQAETAAEKRLLHDGDRTFLVDRDGDIREYRPDDGAKSSLKVHTLTAAINYISNTLERRGIPLIVNILDQDHVQVMSELDRFGNRECLLEAEALHPSFPFGRFISSEEAIIGLQSQFVQTSNMKLLLSFVGNLKEDAVTTSVDDGISQTATVRAGVASVAKGTAPNPIALRPYRTFNEVEQPESEFVFRLHEGMHVGLFEGDGAQWRNEAIWNVSEFLKNQLADKRDHVTILC